jgi:hypothetical protein
VQLWWNRFGPLFVADIRRQRIRGQQGVRHWRWHLDEMFVRLNGEMVIPLAGRGSRRRGAGELGKENPR